MSPSDSRLRPSQWIAGLGGLATGTLMVFALVTHLGAEAQLAAPSHPPAQGSWVDGDWGVAPDPSAAGGTLEHREEGGEVRMELTPATLDHSGSPH